MMFRPMLSLSIAGAVLFAAQSPELHAAGALMTKEPDATPYLHVQPRRGDLTPQKTTPEVEQVHATERRWLDAYEQNDVGAMNSIVANGFIITHENRRTETKAQILASLRAHKGMGGYRHWTEHVKAQSFGDVVVLRGIVISQPVDAPPEKASRRHYTDVYRCRGGRCQVIASHLSLAP